MIGSWLLTISSGMGPVEVRRFVDLLWVELARHITERCGLCLDHVCVHGKATEPSSVDLALHGDSDAFSELLGTHALVHKSERRGKRSRKRWYAGVSYAPFTTLSAVSIDPRDIHFETSRASGAGGQHVNRTESAVRAVHRASGLSVRVQSERSQHQNKRRAIEALTSALERQRSDGQARVTSQRRLQSLHVERGRPVMTWHCVRARLTRAGD